jgi:hypothetical protein
VQSGRIDGTVRQDGSVCFSLEGMDERDECSRSLVRALDGGGMVWEGKEEYTTLDEALQAMEDALSEWR